MQRIDRRSEKGACLCEDEGDEEQRQHHQTGVALLDAEDPNHEQLEDD